MSDLPAEIGPTTEAIIEETRRITPATSDEVRHLVIQVLDPAFQFVEGQSIGVVVPGPHPFGNPYHLRRYSIANARNLPDQERDHHRSAGSALLLPRRGERRALSGDCIQLSV